MQEQKKRLDQLVEGKTKVEKKLNTVSSDLQSQEKKTREDQQQLNTLRQSLTHLSDSEREVRGTMHVKSLTGVVTFTMKLRIMPLKSNSSYILLSLLFSWWISGWLFPRCWVWMPQPWLCQITKSSNHWRPFFTLIITITTFIMLTCPGTVLLTRGLISPKSRTFLTPPPLTSLPPGLQFPFTKPRFLHYTETKLHLKCIIVV